MELVPPNRKKWPSTLVPPKTSWPRKVLSMELVLPNRKKWLSAQVSPLHLLLHQKVLSMELVPPNRKKMTKYTGPTQNRFFNNQFQLIKNYQTSVCIRSHWKQKCYTPKDPARIVVTLVNFRVVMVREWDVPQRSFLIEKKFGGADLAQIQAEYANRLLATSFSFSWLILIFRWPAPTWGITNAPPPASTRSLRRLAKKFREKGTVQDLRRRRASAREGVVEVATPNVVNQVLSALLIRIS